MMTGFLLNESHHLNLIVYILLLLNVLMALSLLHTYIGYTLIATLSKKWTRLDAQQSMAKQPINGYVSNHSRTCGKSVSEKSE